MRRDCTWVTAHVPIKPGETQMLRPRRAAQQVGLGKVFSAKEPETGRSVAAETRGVANLVEAPRRRHVCEFLNFPAS